MPKSSQVNIEGDLLGALLDAPELAPVYAPEIDVAWFSDLAARLVAEAIAAMAAEGVPVNVPGLLARLPPGTEARPNDWPKFVQLLSDRGAARTEPVPLMVDALKTGWARRKIATVGADLMAEAAEGPDPYAASEAALEGLDALNASRARKRAAGDASAAVRDLEAVLAAGRVDGPTTGFASLDELVGGYMAGRMIVVAARPGMGKSAFMTSSLRRTAAAGAGVAIFSLEMGRPEVIARMASDLGGSGMASFGAVVRNRIGDAQRRDLGEPLAEIGRLPMHIDATPRLSAVELAGRARRLKAQFEAAGTPLAVIAVDYLERIRSADRYAGNRVAEVGEMSTLMMTLSRELDVCVVLLAQLNRQLESRDDKRPTLADLRWSGDIEQDADVIAFLYREHYYAQHRATDRESAEETAERLSQRRQLEILVRKNRQGEVRDLDLRCDLARSAIWDPAGDGGPGGML